MKVFVQVTNKESDKLSEGNTTEVGKVYDDTNNVISMEISNYVDQSVWKELLATSTEYNNIS